MNRTPGSLTAELETLFERIRVERMADVPILNAAISVEAVGFTSHGDGDELVGVLITPWFMNLMLIPADPDAPVAASPGETSLASFPAADFEFIAGYEDGFGAYRLCSLFSPMFDFTDHDGAAQTAKAVMEGIMQPKDEAAESAPPPSRPMSRRDLFRTLAGGESA